MTGLSVTEPTENRNGLNTDFTQLQQSFKEKKEVLEERLESYNLTLKAPGRRKGGKGGRAADCVAMPDDELCEKIRVAAHELMVVNQALQMIKDDTYGVCEDCGEPIPEDRLNAKPDACYCINCQTTRERTKGGNGGSLASFV